MRKSSVVVLPTALGPTKMSKSVVLVVDVVIIEDINVE